MELTEITDFDVLLDLRLDIFDQADGSSGYSTVVNVNGNDGKLTFVPF